MSNKYKTIGVLGNTVRLRTEGETYKDNPCKCRMGVPRRVLLDAPHRGNSGEIRFQEKGRCKHKEDRT